MICSPTDHKEQRMLLSDCTGTTDLCIFGNRPFGIGQPSAPNFVRSDDISGQQCGGSVQSHFCVEQCVVRCVHRHLRLPAKIEV